MSHRNQVHTKMSDEQESWWSSSSTPRSEINPMPDQIAKALQKSSRKTWNHSVLKRLGFFTNIILIC